MLKVKVWSLSSKFLFSKVSFATLPIYSILVIIWLSGRRSPTIWPNSRIPEKQAESQITYRYEPDIRCDPSRNGAQRWSLTLDPNTCRMWRSTTVTFAIIWALWLRLKSKHARNQLRLILSSKVWISCIHLKENLYGWDTLNCAHYLPNVPN